MLLAHLELCKKIDEDGQNSVQPQYSIHPIKKYILAGQQYFVKYEEEQFRGGPNGDASLLRVGPLMQMPTRQGLKEIGMTQLKTPGLNFVGELDSQRELVKGSEKIDSGKYHASDDVHTTVLFKLWNPLTW